MSYIYANILYNTHKSIKEKQQNKQNKQNKQNNNKNQLNTTSAKAKINTKTKNNTVCNHKYLYKYTGQFICNKCGHVIIVL